MINSSAEFYQLLPIQSGFTRIANLSVYSEIPDDWCVIVADVRNSTFAIQKGEYKAVNITGVAVITSVLNISKPLDVPYIFGGDGATLCIPGNIASQVRSALIATRNMARRQFGLILRIGIIPMNVITHAGHRIMVARYRVSEHFIQAAFAGAGIEYAERIIKDDTIDSSFRIEAQDESLTTDYTGLECRWENVPSKRGETIALIVRAIAPSMEKQADIYNEIITKILEIYGDDELSRPVYKEGLQTTMNNRQLQYEFKTKTCDKGIIDCIKYWLFLKLQILTGRILMKYGFTAGETDWGQYKEDLVRNTDFRKFDGVLREILSGNSEQRRELTEYLEKRLNKGECVYGIHVSKAAMITCLIRNRSGDHCHFVDGTDGGYAMAASSMKERIKSLS